MSRVIAERISVARFSSRSGLSRSVEQIAQNRGISSRCTVAIIRENDTVNREHDTVNRQHNTYFREYIPSSTKGHVVLADKIDIFFLRALVAPNAQHQRRIKGHM